MTAADRSTRVLFFITPIPQALLVLSFFPLPAMGLLQSPGTLTWSAMEDKAAHVTQI